MKYKTALLTLVFSMAVSGPASANLIIDITEAAGNVEATLTGSVNLAATLGFGGIATSTTNFFSPIGGNISFGGGVNSEFYSISVDWTPFGPGAFKFWDSSSGDRVALFSGSIGVPLEYLTGSGLSATATELSATFTSLGMTVGSFVTTFSNGDFSDSVTVNIGQSVPEPTTLALFGLGLAGLGYARKRKA